MDQRARIIPGTIISAGFDWVTAYGAGLEARSVFAGIGDSLIAEERKAAEGESAAKLFGFEGYRGKHWFYGSRVDGRMIVLSSGLAVHAGPELIAAATNVSRLDLQVTYALDVEDTDLALKAFNRLQSGVVTQGRPHGFSITNTKPKGQTLNVNKRIGDRSARLYDKGVEAKLCGPGRLWRWELELKRHLAHRAAVVSQQHTNLATYSAGCVKAFFCSKGLEPRWSNSVADLAGQSVLTRPTRDVLDWFAGNVSHSVRRAINRHGYAKVVEALGMDQLVHAAKELDNGRPPTKDHSLET